MILLWISPRWPFPPDDGARQASASLLESLAAAGHRVFVLHFDRERSAKAPPHPGIRVIAHLRAPGHGLIPRLRALGESIFSGLPVSAQPFAGFSLRWEELRGLLPGAPDAVVVDGCHAFAGFADQRCPWPLIYRAHNVEASLWTQAAARAPGFARPFLRWQGARMARFENALVAASSAVAAISPEDARCFQSNGPAAPVEWVPPGFPFPESRPPAPSGALRVGFIGRLDWPPNRHGLRWFLERVWPELKKGRPELRFLVAGSGDGAWLRRFSGCQAEFLGRVERVETFYEQVQAVVVPIFFGSGSKIKLIEAARFSRAVFSTPSGWAGSALPAAAAALVSEDAEEWCRAITNSDPGALREQGNRLFRAASRIYGEAESRDRFLSLLPPHRRLH